MSKRQEVKEYPELGEMDERKREILEAFLALKGGELSEFKRKFGSILGDDEISPEMERKVRQELEADYERVKLQPIGMDVDDDEDLTQQDRADLAEGERTLREHNEQILTEFGLWRKGKETIKESKPITEGLMFEPARITKISSGKTTITEEGRDHVGTGKDGMVMVGAGLWLPKDLAETGGDDEILEYMREHRIGLA